MRQDVKLGLAIGGILLAVLIVYVLVVPGDNGAPGVQLVDANGNPVTDSSSSNTLDVTGPTETQTPVTPVPIETPADLVAATSNDPFESGNTGTPSITEPVASNATGDRAWDDLFSGQAQLPPMMSETPPPVANRSVVAPAAESSSPQVVASNEPIAPQTPSVFDPAAAAVTEAPATPLPASAATAHVVKTGETLSSISAAAYGSPNFYPHILRANPDLNPNRLKVGTTIKLPALSEVRPQQQTTEAVTAITVNPVEQYKVAAGDSLYTISVKLYGKADRVDKLYEANKSTIGSDPAKLKVGIVLTLPEPPSVATR